MASAFDKANVCLLSTGFLLIMCAKCCQFIIGVSDKSLNARKMLGFSFPQKRARLNTMSQNGTTLCNNSKTDLGIQIELILKSARTRPRNRHKCHHCQALFKSPSELHQHFRVHNGQRPYVCQFCLTGFTQKANRDKHFLKHSGQRPYLCQYCDRLFIDSSNYKSHLRMHNGHRPYQCLKCDKSFNEFRYLNEHTTAKHDNSRPYQCSICELRFSQRPIK